jgi:hypothetical protein
MQPVQKAVYQRGFPCAHFAGKRDEAFAIVHAIHQPTQRFFDLLGQEEIARIRVGVEGIFF